MPLDSGGRSPGRVRPLLPAAGTAHGESTERGLRPQDRFNVVLFAGGSHVMSPQSVEATADNLDAAARVKGYNADITRTYPVSGAFTARQREVYGVVLKAQEAAIAPRLEDRRG